MLVLKAQLGPRLRNSEVWAENSGHPPVHLEEPQGRSSLEPTGRGQTGQRMPILKVVCPREDSFPQWGRERVTQGPSLLPPPGTLRRPGGTGVQYEDVITAPGLGSGGRRLLLQLQ